MTTYRIRQLLSCWVVLVGIHISDGDGWRCGLLLGRLGSEGLLVAAIIQQKHTFSKRKECGRVGGRRNREVGGGRGRRQGG